MNRSGRDLILRRVLGSAYFGNVNAAAATNDNIPNRDTRVYGIHHLGPKHASYRTALHQIIVLALSKSRDGGLLVAVELTINIRSGFNTARNHRPRELMCHGKLNNLAA